MVYLYLFLAIAAEVVATSALKLSDEFTRFWPSMTVVVAYGIAFYFLAMVLKIMPVGVAYAIWSGVGITLITLMGYVVFQQSLDWAAILGMCLIVSGVVIMNVFSKTISH